MFKSLDSCTKEEVVLNKYSEYVDKHRFLFEELVKRDFKKKYKRTVLGLLWSILSPLVMLSVMSFVFSQFFGRNIEYYVLYILAGQVVFAYFSESTNNGMLALLNNANIFSKINLPKYLFVLSRNITALINFGLILLLFFCFVFAYGIKPNILMILCLYPIVCLIMFNYGISLILSALYVFYRDMQYLYSLLLQVIMYGSAIFYNIDILSSSYQSVFYLNPLYIYITFLREVIIYNSIPDVLFFQLSVLYAIISVIIGMYIYKKYNYKFIYYI